jgi:hypothetical protein
MSSVTHNRTLTIRQAEGVVWANKVVWRSSRHERTARPGTWLITPSGEHFPLLPTPFVNEPLKYLTMVEKYINSQIIWRSVKICLRTCCVIRSGIKTMNRRKRHQFFVCVCVCVCVWVCVWVCVVARPYAIRVGFKETIFLRNSAYVRIGYTVCNENLFRFSHKLMTFKTIYKLLFYTSMVTQPYAV